MRSSGMMHLPPALRTGLQILSLTSLILFVILALVVSHDQAPYGFEKPIPNWFGASGATHAWNDVVEVLAIPVIIASTVGATVIGFVRRAPVRVVTYLVIAAATFLMSDYVVKPLVQRSYYGEYTFPSGNVTAVSSLALALWLALYPLCGKELSSILAFVGAAWLLLMGVAVVGALWHTPVDVLGSILFSVGVVGACASLYERAASCVDTRSSKSLAGENDETSHIR